MKEREGEKKGERKLGILYFSVLLPIVSILLCIVYINCMVFTGM